jgi:hypothetical protein
MLWHISPVYLCRLLYIVQAYEILVENFCLKDIIVQL